MPTLLMLCSPLVLSAISAFSSTHARTRLHTPPFNLTLVRLPIPFCAVHSSNLSHVAHSPFAAAPIAYLSSLLLRIYIAARLNRILAIAQMLNALYEEAYPGLRFVTFVNGRARAEVVPEMEVSPPCPLVPSPTSFYSASLADSSLPTSLALTGGSRT